VDKEPVQDKRPVGNDAVVKKTREKMVYEKICWEKENKILITK
jgi:hypothetical protein